MEPKWRPGAYKLHKKIDAEFDPKFCRFFVDFGSRFGSQNGAEIEQKSVTIFFRFLSIFVDFRVPVGVADLGDGGAAGYPLTIAQRTTRSHYALLFVQGTATSHSSGECAAGFTTAAPTTGRAFHRH